MADSFDSQSPPPKRALRSNTAFLPLAPPPQKLFYSIRETILGTNESYDLTFKEIPPDTGLQTASSLCEDPEIERKHPRYVIKAILI
jgi:hypothetical protein